ncbi:hypothetical protein GOP47_0030968, partial [Adiantum capillus-veneris]
MGGANCENEGVRREHVGKEIGEGAGETVLLKLEGKETMARFKPSMPVVALKRPML